MSPTSESYTVPFTIHGAQAAEPSDREKAEKAHLACFKSLSDLHVRLKALRTLFGTAVGDALQGPVSEAQDHAYDAAAHFRRALARETEVTRLTQDENRRLHQRLADATADIDRLSTELVARHRKARKPIPEWITDIRSDIEVPF